MLIRVAVVHGTQHSSGSHCVQGLGFVGLSYCVTSVANTSSGLEALKGPTNKADPQCCVTSDLQTFPSILFQAPLR